jgi:hypothetical protein
MKVNPIGVQSYQELVKRDQTPAQKPQQEAEQPVRTTMKPLNIKPQDEAQRSRLAVKAPRASYADNLTEAEQRAMDLLFSRFKDTGRFGPGYKTGDETATDEPGIGQFVDVKA